jgi:hypothetical protein
MISRGNNLWALAIVSLSLSGRTRIIPVFSIICFIEMNTSHSVIAAIRKITLPGFLPGACNALCTSWGELKNFDRIFRETGSI